MYKLFYSIALLLCCASMLSVGRGVVFDEIDNRDGLSSDVVNAVYQDNNGFIWIATADGLNCYTGTEFITYKHKKNDPNSLASSRVTSVCMDLKGRLWVGSPNKGISILNTHTHTITHLNSSTLGNELVDDHIYDIICDTRGRVWILSLSGLSLYDPLSESLKYFSSLVKTVPTSLLELSDGNIIIGTRGKSVLHFSENKQDFEKIEIVNGELLHFTNKTMFEDRQGYLWIGMWGDGLYKARYYNGKITILSHIEVYNDNFSRDDSYNIVYDINQDDNNDIWIGTDVGLGRIIYSKENDILVDWIPVGKGENEFKSKDAKAVFVDASNAIWISTQGNGVLKLDNNQTNFKTCTSPPSSFNSDVFRSFWKIEDDLFVGMHALGFGKYNLNTGELTSYSQLPVFDGINKVVGDLNAVISCDVLDDGKLWMLTRYKGFVVYDLQKRKASRLSMPLPCKETTTYLIEKNKIWIGTNAGLVLCVKDKKRRGIFPYKRVAIRYEKDKPNGLFSNNISDIHRTKDGQLLISYADGGVDLVLEDSLNFKSTKFKRAAIYNEKFWPNINVMFEDVKGHVWLGTQDEGLALLDIDYKEIIDFCDATSLNDKTIFSVQEDRDNNLWLSSNHGLYSFNYLEVTTPYITNFNVEDGLQGNIFIHGASYRDDDGNLYFGGYNGFNFFNPSDIQYNKNVPPLAFTEIKVDHEPRYIDYLKGNPLIINHDNNSFQIKFEALSYSKSYNNQYQYKLDGWENKWVNINNNDNRAVYGKLLPGNYTFKFRGSNNHGVWNTTPLELNVIVKKAYYKTTAAYVLYVFILLCIVYFYVYYTQRNFKLKQAYKEEYNERKRADKINQFKLKFFTNISHELLTPLSIISNAVEQYVIERPNEEKHLAVVKRNTNRLTRLINQLLDFRKAEGDSLNLMVQENDFNHLISSLKDNFEPLCERKNISFVLDGTIDKTIFFDIDKVDKMLHNILSNAFKHTPLNGEIILEYSKLTESATDMLCVKVKDSGPGIPENLLDTIFDRFYRIDDHSSESGAGIGLAFTKSLLKLHKGTITAENSNKGGAVFTVMLPVSRSAFTDDEMAPSTEVPELSYSFPEEMDEIKSDIRLQRESDAELPKILLVEDNADMRMIVRNYLCKYFDIYESENGEEGLEMLKEHDIELIVSDIMMPKMDGLTFCKRVKSGIMTSHIPVILTTAKRTQQNYIEGYEAQADSYITKPINLQLLLVRIINLLNQRQDLRQLFSDSKKPDVKKLAINNLDQELLEKLNDYIEKNIDNSNLTIGMLSDHVNISSSVFYRKLKAFTGMSPNEYLRTKRLNKAAALLKTGMSASAVAYECGFSDPSYFGVTFKKHFGMPPKKFIESL